MISEVVNGFGKRGKERVGGVRTCSVDVARVVEGSREEFETNNSVDDDDENNKKRNVKQRHHRSQDGV